MYVMYCVFLSALRVMYVVQYALGYDDRVVDASYVLDSRSLVYAILVLGLFVKCYIAHVGWRFYACVSQLTLDEQRCLHGDAADGVAVYPSAEATYRGRPMCERVV